MAKKAIVVEFGDEETSFSFSKVGRDKLYGRKERVILDAQGERCVSAYLTPDGAALVPPGGTAHVYTDEAFSTVDRKALEAQDDEGQKLESFPSTLGVAQTLEPTRAERLLDHVIESVYELSAEEVGGALAGALKDGEIFEAAYNYRDGFVPGRVFILQNEHGMFGLVGKDAQFEMLRREEIEAPEEDDDELGDDLDFSMM